MNKLHFGTGENYMKGFVNLDFNKNIKADVYHDFHNLPLPFTDNYFDYVYTSHTLEHIRKEMFFKVMDELLRICKNGTIIDVTTPHFTSINAMKNPSHYTEFGINTFIFFTNNVADKQRYSKERLEVIEQRLYFASPTTPFIPFKILNLLNPLFNLMGTKWQQTMERFQVFGFDEIYFKLRVIKDEVKGEWSKIFYL